MDSYDPYTDCEVDCNHDLAWGVSIEMLLQDDGPYLPVDVVRWPPIVRPAGIAEEEAA